MINFGQSIEVPLKQKDLSFVPFCKTETWDIGGDCMDCQIPSLDPHPSPVHVDKIT